MNVHASQSAKILNHSAGMGVPSPDTVEGRAREIAQIDGRKLVNARDWQQALVELHGGHSEHNGSGQEMIASFSEHDMVAPGIAHQTPRYTCEDDDSVLEELVAEGLDEAAHEQMLAARRAVLDTE